jgi:signal transduction histidine kinase
VNSSSQRSIFWRYLRLLGVTAAALVAVPSLFHVWLTFQSNDEQTARLQNAEARLIQSQVTGLLSTINQHLAVVAAIPWGVQDLGVNERVTEYRRILSVLPAVLDLVLLNAEGQQLLLVAPNRPNEFSGESAHQVLAQSALRSKRPVFSGTSYDAKTVMPFISIALADHRKTGQVSVARVSLQTVSDQLSTLAQQHQAAAFIVDARGNLVAHSERTMALRPHSMMGDSAVVRALNSAGFGPNADGASGKVDVEREGRAFVSSWAQLDDPNWIFFLEQERSKVMRPVYRAVALAGMLTGLALIVATIASALLARHLSKPVEALSSSAARLAKGDLSHRVSLAQGSEFSTVAVSFNAMARSIQELTAGLEDKIQAKTLELEHAFSLKEEKAAEIVKLEERTRIMRDFHDTVGGHLVALLGLTHHEKVDSKQISQIVQDSLVDFRIAIDSLSPNQLDLGTALASLRYRLQARIQGSGFSSEWTLGEIPEDVIFNQEEIFHIQRIITESVTNSIKHARNASSVNVLVHWDADNNELLVCITDDGFWAEPSVGLVPPLSVSGRGLSNLVNRANALNGRILIDRGLTAQGSKVSLVVPRSVKN